MLHWAAGRGCLDFCTYLVLLNADPGAEDSQDRTSIYCADSAGHRGTAEILAKLQGIEASSELQIDAQAASAASAETRRKTTLETLALVLHSVHQSADQHLASDAAELVAHFAKVAERAEAASRAPAEPQARQETLLEISSLVTDVLRVAGEARRELHFEASSLMDDVLQAARQVLRVAGEARRELRFEASSLKPRSALQEDEGVQLPLDNIDPATDRLLQACAFSGSTPLEFAVACGNLELCKNVAKCARICKLDDDVFNVRHPELMRTPLHVAAGPYCFPEVKTEQRVSICKYLAEARADLRLINAGGNTPLDLAVRCGSRDLIVCVSKLEVRADFAAWKAKNRVYAVPGSKEYTAIVILKTPFAIRREVGVLDRILERASALDMRVKEEMKRLRRK